MEETVADTSHDRTATADELPETLGRYRVERVLGAGMMGVVFEAFDPELERRRAIKLMQPARKGDRARARFLREAKAMARLEHPNVVSVYDVGTHNKRPFVVMDLVSGSTLEEWIQRESPGWRAVLKKFVQAGRGLAAAHEAGLVHRDFKPDNVLVAHDGTVKVTDFGLVRSASESSESQPIQLDNIPSGDLTRTGAVIGTPAYMPPEQIRGDPADAASDQFSFCVSLFEGMYRCLPFSGQDLSRVMERAERGEFYEPPNTDVPTWVFDVIKRGLNAEPAERWPDMNTLLDRLDLRRHRSGRWMVAAAGIVGLTGAAIGLAVSSNELQAWWSPVNARLGLDEATIEEPMRTRLDVDEGDYAFSPVANKGRVTFNVELPNSGRYYLWGLAWERSIGGDRGDADSFFVYVDGGDERLWHFGCQNEGGDTLPTAGNWRWQRIGDMPNSDSDCVVEDLSFDLEAGSHQIVIRNREGASSNANAARLARIVVTNDSDFLP